MPSSLLALLDDVTTVLDDVAILTKVAAKKTAGVLGDDLALNAEQVAGVRAERELPVVWAVFRGSLVNKLILVPAALAVSALAPWAVTPLLMLGGLFLCYEGVEKIAHKLLRRREEKEHKAELHAALLQSAADLAAVEREKIRGAIRTDFVLSAEIITIALGTVAEAPFGTRLAVLAGIGLAMTIGVYGLVAAIVKLDDLGAWLRRSAGAAAALRRALGAGILRAAPLLMRLLAVAGTLAMFLVGGGILVHGIPSLHHLAEGLAARGGLVAALGPSLVGGLAGVLAGAAVFVGATLGRRVLTKRR